MDGAVAIDYMDSAIDKIREPYHKVSQPYKSQGALVIFGKGIPTSSFELNIYFNETLATLATDIFSETEPDDYGIDLPAIKALGTARIRVGRMRKLAPPFG